MISYLWLIMLTMSLKRKPQSLLRTKLIKETDFSKVLKNDQTVSPKQCTDYDDHEEIKGNDDQLTNNNNNLVNSIHNSDNIPSKMKKKFLLIDDVA